MTRPMFPHAVDSTILSAFRSCPQKAFRTYIEHWKPQSESVHLVAGGAFAAGIETARRAFYEEKAEPEKAIQLGILALIKKYGNFEAPEGSAKTLERMCGALEYYFSQYPLATDHIQPAKLPSGKSGIEFSFTHPLGINHPVTGDPILYTGRCDMIAEAYEGIYVVDEKTTTQLGQSWSRQWELRSQFTGYCWATQEYGFEPKGAIVRGVSILKTKYDTLQEITYRNQYEIDRWYHQVIRDVQRMIKCWEDGWWDYSLDTACTEYGGCGLVRICKSPDPETWLPMLFEKKVWDPIERTELTLDQWHAKWGHQS